jgi:hypothetical protein
VSFEVITTSAPGTTAFAASVTTPLKEAVALCPKAAGNNGEKIEKIPRYSAIRFTSDLVLLDMAGA